MSTSTVSRALNDNPAISKKTRLLVKKTAGEMSYVPNTFAVNLKRGRSNMIGVLVPYIDRSFFSSAIEGIEEEAYKLGYDVLICQSKDSYEREKHILNALSKGKVDGVVASLAAQTKDYSHYRNLSQAGVPLVLFDRMAEDVGDVRVTADDYRGGYDMVRHLVEQGKERIFHYGGFQHVSVWKNRYLGYRDALADSGITVGEDWLTEGTMYRKDGVDYARKVLEMDERPDAVFCSSDYVALGMLMELERLGVRVPEDIAVAGFANEYFGELIEPSLTSVDQHSKEMGRISCNKLMELLAGRQAEDVVLAPELKIRDSTRKVN